MKSLVLSFAFAATALAADPPVPPVLPIGSPVPDFALPGIDGKTY